MRGIGLPFLLTTFVTSFAWILFACSAVAIGVMSWWPFTERFLDEIQASDRPTVGFASLGYAVVALGYAVVALLYGAVALLAGFAVAPSLPEGRDGEPAVVAMGETYRGIFADSTEFRVSFEARADLTYVIEARGNPLVSLELVLRRNGLEIQPDYLNGASFGYSGTPFWVGMVYRVDEDEKYVVEISPREDAVGPLFGFYFTVREAQDAEASPGDGETQSGIGVVAGDESPEVRQLVAAYRGTPLAVMEQTGQRSQR